MTNGRQDERNPSARWCPRPGCEELIVCESAADFTCPACSTRGCFRCRGYAHRFWFCTVKEEDASYLEWEKSVGERRTIRPCPQCKMRIWKAEGCVWLQRSVGRSHSRSLLAAQVQPHQVRELPLRVLLGVRRSVGAQVRGTFLTLLRCSRLRLTRRRSAFVH